MPTNLYLRLSSPTGTELTIITDFYSIEYARRVNDVGAMSLKLPVTYWSLMKKDVQIVVWRENGAGVWLADGETTWFVRRWTYAIEENGLSYILVTAFDANTLLNRRIVAYYSGSAYAQKSGAAETVIKAIMKENFGTLTANRDTGSRDAGALARDISSYLAIQVDAAGGTTVSKAFAWQTVLKAIQDIADESTNNGTYLAFDIIRLNNGLFEFRTYLNQRGVNRTRSGLAANVTILEPERGNLTSVNRTVDYTTEVTAVYSGGQGDGVNRTIGYASDSARIAESPFGLIEDMYDGRNSSDSISLTSEATAVLFAGRPINSFSAKVVQTASCRYGRDYNFGDVVTATVGGESIDCRLDGYRYTADAGDENIELLLTKTLS